MANLIDRDKLLNRLKEKHEKGLFDYFKDILNEIEETPEANQWIPCTERLPKEYRFGDALNSMPCLITVKYDDRVFEQCATYYLHREGDEYTWVSYETDGLYAPLYKLEDVIAWMPLPEVYKENDE